MEKAFIQLKMSTVIPARRQAKACVGDRPPSAGSSPSWFGRGLSILQSLGSTSSHVLRSHPSCSDLTYASHHEESSSAFFGAFDTDSEVLEWPRKPGPEATPTTRAWILLPRSFSIPAGGFYDDLGTPSPPHVFRLDLRHRDHALGPRRARFHGRGGGSTLGFVLGCQWNVRNGHVRSIPSSRGALRHPTHRQARQEKRTTGRIGDRSGVPRGWTRRVGAVLDADVGESNTVLWHVQK
mmetsp:Transcript_6985/g.42801  ORF Transcript_6985/g.42801 Transcript_6985/m.42801 type:complete len:238 (+) Transcript_6985:1547-2260(+)